MTSKKQTMGTKEGGKPALVTRLRFSEFSGAWEMIPIGEKVDLLSGYPFDGPEISQDSSGVRLLRGINITEGRIRHTPEIDRYYTGQTDGLKKFRVRVNDLVIGMDGSKVGKNSALISDDDADALLIQRVARLRSANPTLIQFIFQQINSTTFHSYVDKINTSSGIPHISAKQIRDFTIAFPSPAEQQKIAECLSSVDEVIAAQARKVDALKTHKKGLMQKLFPREGETQPRLRFPEFKGDWVLQSGAKITSKITKGSSPNWQGFSYQKQGVLFITSENVRDGFLDVSEPKFLPEEFFAKQSNSHLLYGDILINIVGASIGRNCVYRLQRSAFTNQAVALFRVAEEHSFEFVSYCYQHDRSQKAVSASQSDSARPNLSLADLRNMEFFIPSLAEQERVASCLSSLDDLISAETQKLEALKRHKRGLMQQLFPSPDGVAG